MRPSPTPPPKIDLPDMQAEAFALLAQVPTGSVTTYGDIARGLGDDQAKSARWLGELFKNHDHNEDCVCHRVVRSNGELGHFVTGDVQEKARLLGNEGIVVSETGIVDLSQRWPAFTSTKPLHALRQFQRECVQRSNIDVDDVNVATVAGVDVAYQDGYSFGAYVLLDATTLQPLAELTTRQSTKFPYIPGYLTFRELPVMLDLCQQAAKADMLGDVLFVDGNGILHPWRAGIAVCLGTMLNTPTLGIGKSLLCGSVDLDNMTAEEMRAIHLNKDLVGYALKTTDTSKPVYASPGHLISVNQAATLAHTMMTEHRVPEPIYFADRLTKQLARG